MSEGRWILRVQDRWGRGPWRPGFSSSWISRSDNAPPLPPAIQEEFPEYQKIVSEAHAARLHIGCGVRGSAGLAKWFLPEEIQRLKDRRFVLVRAHACKILAESDNQVIFAARKPLRFLPHVSWPSFSLAENVA
jgi:hypothetical protein